MNRPRQLLMLKANVFSLPSSLSLVKHLPHIVIPGMQIPYAYRVEYRCLILYISRPSGTLYADDRQMAYGLYMLVIVSATDHWGISSTPDFRFARSR